MIPEYDLTGKVAFITGAGRGIGKGIAQVLAEAGADVATMLCTRAAGPHMLARGSGKVVNVGSFASVTIGEAAYAERQKSAAKTIPLGREGRLREVGLATLYLASAASDYMTGQTLYLDGGLTL